MKKTLFAIGAMVAMVACSNDFVVKEAAQEAIGFDNAFVDNSTRSVSDPSLNASNLTNFQVFGYVEGAPLFDADNTGVTVTGSGVGNNASWKYDANKTQYWIAGAHYNFNAVAPATGWTKANTTNATQTTLSFDNNGTTDLLYAQNDTYTANADDTPNGKVAFTFRHTLSKVKFSFENAYNASNSTIKVYNIKINNAYTTANVALTDDETTWSDYVNGNLVLNFGVATDDETTADKENDEVAQKVGTYESQKELFLIPFNYTADNALNITFTVDLLVNGELIKTYNHEIELSAKFEPGKSYDLKAVIDPEHIDPENKQEPIEFTVDVINGWEQA